MHGWAAAVYRSRPSRRVMPSPPPRWQSKGRGEEGKIFCFRLTRGPQKENIITAISRVAVIQYYSKRKKKRKNSALVTPGRVLKQAEIFDDSRGRTRDNCVQAVCHLRYNGRPRGTESKTRDSKLTLDFSYLVFYLSKWRVAA